MLENAFEEVYVINMPRRTDRWEQFLQRLPEDWPFKKPIRYEALDGGVVSPPTWWNGGNGAWALGCQSQKRTGKLEPRPRSGIF